MRIDLHCPVELLDSEILRDDRGNVRAYLTLGNLAPSRIDRFEACVRWTNDEGGAHEAIFTAENLRAPARATFTVSVSTGDLPGATALELVFLRVCFEEGGADWIGSPHRLTDVPDLPAPDGRDLNRLLALAGPDAVNFPYLNDRLWICVCGRPNPRRRKKCARCGRGRDQVLREYDMAGVLRAPMPAKKPPSVSPPPFNDAQRKDFEKARASFLRQRSLLIRRSVTMLVVALLIVIIAFLARRLSDDPKTTRDSIPPVKIENAE